MNFLTSPQSIAWAMSGSPKHLGAKEKNCQDLLSVYILSDKDKIICRLGFGSAWGEGSEICLRDHIDPLLRL